MILLGQSKLGCLIRTVCWALSVGLYTFLASKCYVAESLISEHIWRVLAIVHLDLEMFGIGTNLQLVLGLDHHIHMLFEGRLRLVLDCPKLVASCYLVSEDLLFYLVSNWNKLLVLWS